MLCKKCGKKQANIYYKQTVNGKTKEYALCEDCAEELKKSGELDIKMPSLWNKYDNSFGLEDLFGINGLLSSPFEGVKTVRSEKKKCSLCGSTFDGLVKNGKVGCAKCYEIFADELRRTVESIHGKEQHTGRTPKRIKAKESKTDKINALKAELKSAVKKQEFEQAAVLRDEIRRLEEEN